MKKHVLLSTLILLSASALDAKMPFISQKKPAEPQKHARHDRITAKHREGNGIGYPTGYSTVEGFFSYTKGTNLVPFIDARFHVFNDSKKAYNVGAGLRTLSQSLGTVFGLNVFYDYRDGLHRAFSQIGVGFEVLGQKWDLRGNGYIPVHNTKKKYRDEFLKFKASSAVFAKRYEFAFIGCELALGRELFKTKYWDMHAKLAPYWFNGQYGKNAGGGLFELSTNITRYLTLKGQVSYDTLFRDVFQGEAAINIAFGPKFKDQKTGLSVAALQDLENRLVESVDRFEIIVTSTKRKKAVALDPLTGQPLKFIFVDNTSHSLGTFESPFPTLAQAQAASAPDNVIYIFPGDGTSNGLSSGITLLNNQKLIGSAAALQVTTAFGVRTIPQQTLNTPLLTNATGSVVTLANNNQVSGFTIASSAGNPGIIGTNTFGIEISYNKFLEAATEDSIHMTNLITNFLAHNNTFVGSGTGINLNISNSFNFFSEAQIVQNIFRTGIGCTITATNGAPDILIESNAFVPPSSLNATIGIRFVGSTPSLTQIDSTLRIRDNLILNITNGNGIDVTAGQNDLLKLDVRSNIIDNIGNNGIQALVDLNGALFTEISHNLVTRANALNASSSGVLVKAQNTASNSIVALRLVDNASSASFNGFGFVLSPNTGSNVFGVQSPNLNITGVEALNKGTFNVAGAGLAGITFAPFIAPQL